LPNLVMYRDLIRDTTRGIGPALTPVGGPTVAPHPPLVNLQPQAQLKFRPAHFLPPFRPSIATVDASPVTAGSSQLAGADEGAVTPVGEVSN
jgi:hypothetical protein